MEPITRMARRNDQPTDSQKRAEAVRKICDYYAERYGAEFADLARRSTHDHFGH